MSSDIRTLVRTMADANVTWGAPRIHGELLKLGFEISEHGLALDAEATQRTIPNVEDFSE